MQYVFLFTPEPLRAEAMERLASDMGLGLSAYDDGGFHFNTYAFREHQRYIIPGDHLKHLRFEPPESPDALFESDYVGGADELALIKRLGPTVVLYVMHFKDVNVLREALYKLASTTSYLLDDTHSLVVDSQKFTQLCDANPTDDEWWFNGIYSAKARQYRLRQNR